MARTLPERPTWLIIPCGAEKADHTCAARDLYVGSMFRMALAAAEAEAADTDATILILSARHGLVELDTILEPYDTKMGDPGSVTAAQVTVQAMALSAASDYDADVYAFLPRAYFEVLDEALRALYIYPADVYEATIGIGEHRKVCRIVRDTEFAA